MKKILLSFLLLILLCLIFCSCSTPSDNSYTAAVLGVQDASIFSNATVITSSQNVYISKTAEKEKLITVNANQIQLEYKQSEGYSTSGRSLDSYESADGTVLCKYFENTNNIAQISYSNTEKFNQQVFSEFEYLNSIYSLIEKYGYIIPDDYEYSCETIVRTYGEDYIQNDKIEYFISKSSLNENQEIGSYTFRFTKHIDGCPTSDVVSVYLSEGSVIAKFSHNDFDMIDDISIDKSTALEKLEYFIENSINKEKYSLESYEIISNNLAIVENKICIRYSVEIELRSKNDDGVFSCLEDIVIFES